MIVMFLANGFEEVEALTPLDLLRRAGETIITVGIGGREITGSHGITVLADTDDAHLPSQAPDMIILPGGMPGSATLDTSSVVDRVLADAATRDAYLTAICAAPMILGKRGILNGKNAVCYPGFEAYLDGAAVSADKKLVTDGKIITAKGMGVATELGLELVRILCGTEKSDALRKTIIAE